jgi:hypothetical protein
MTAIICISVLLNVVLLLWVIDLADKLDCAKHVIDILLEIDKN